MKRFFLIAALAVMVASLFGCGEGGSKSSDTAATPAAGAENKKNVNQTQGVGEPL